MDEDQCMYENIMSKEVDMDYENEQECGVNEPHVDCSDAFNTSQVFGTRDDVLQWARSVSHENRFVAVIMRSDTHTSSRGRSSFVLIDCEMNGQYKCRKKEFVRRDTGSRKCGCPFKLRGKSVIGGQSWMVKLIYGIHNHELAKSLVGHPYAGRLTKDEKTIIADMTKSMVKPRNILLTLKEHNANSCTTIKQIYNARSAYRSSIRGNNTYKTNRYRLPLLDFVGVTPTGMTFFARFVYLEGEHFHECLQKFEMACSPWPMFVDYVNETWIIPYMEKFVTAWTNKRLLGMVSRYDLNEIAAKFEHVHYAGKNSSSYGCVMRTTHDLPCACELSRYVVGSIPLDSIHMFWRRLSFSDQGLCEAEVTIKEEIETISKRFEELDVCGKVTLKSKLQEIAYPDQNSMCPPPSKVNTKGAPKKPMIRNQRSTKRDPNSSVKRSASFSDPPNPTRIISMSDQFEPFIQGFIDNIVDVKVDGNFGYWSIATLLGMDEDSWLLVHNQLVKELGKWSDDYINLFDGIDKFDELRRSLLVDGFSKVSMDKWMNIMEMRYVIASSIISQPPTDSFVHRIICVGHVFGNHFVQTCGLRNLKKG
ncbi:hypothetical protein GmHk_17G049552 [Glycine max]|nr:hypothetical protein GmHk_17G049552 [Glycine max]